MNKLYIPSIGPISAGTLRSEDLIDAFSSELARFSDVQDGPMSNVHTLLKECDDWLDCEDAESWEANHDGDYEETGSELVNDLIDELTSRAPAYVYFSALDGDGAMFGWWPSIESLENDVDAGEVLKVSDTSEIPEHYQGYVMHVNDHGNVTLYDHANGKCFEVWSCV